MLILLNEYKCRYDSSSCQMLLSFSSVLLFDEHASIQMMKNTRRHHSNHKIYSAVLQQQQHLTTTTKHHHLTTQNNSSKASNNKSIAKKYASINSCQCWPGIHSLQRSAISWTTSSTSSRWETAYSGIAIDGESQ